MRPTKTCRNRRRGWGVTATNSALEPGEHAVWLEWLGTEGDSFAVVRVTVQA